MAAQNDFSDDDLLAYLDEMLPVERMTEIERALRDSESLRRRAAAALRRRESGAHTVGEIWRQERLSCPSRNRLGGYLLGTLDPATADYIEFHVYTVGCRYCAANLDDLRDQLPTGEPETRRRRQRFFESSAGYLRSEDENG